MGDGRRTKGKSLTSARLPNVNSEVHVLALSGTVFRLVCDLLSLKTHNADVNHMVFLFPLSSLRGVTLVCFAAPFENRHRAWVPPMRPQTLLAVGRGHMGSSGSTGTNVDAPVPH